MGVSEIGRRSNGVRTGLVLGIGTMVAIFHCGGT